MTLPSILIVESDLLLGAAIEHLLARDKSLNVVGITPKNELDLIGAVWHIRPDTIVLSQNSRLTTAARLLHQFPDSPNLQIITVNPRENSVELYGRKRMPVTPANNLTAMIQSCCYSSCGFPTGMIRALANNLQKPVNTIELS